MTAVLARPKTEFFGLRPMDPIRDLGGVANLVEEAFANDLDRAGQSALRELRWLSRLKPILWWMVYFSIDHSDFLSGFVWEEGGKIVGNITVNRTSPGSRRWLISNLAVSKSYRGRGIGRSLMDAGLELVKEYNGISVSLQVRADNVPARRLYASLDFMQIAGTTHLQAERVPPLGTIRELPRFPKGVILRSRNYSSKDARHAYNLACAATPLSAQKVWPLHQRDFQLSSQDRLNNFLRQLVGGGPSAHWIVEDGYQFASTVDIRPGILGQMHQVRLVVHPDWRGYLEKPLIGRALSYLYPWRNGGVTVKHPVDHVEAVETFKEFGFQEEQTLLWMKRAM